MKGIILAGGLGTRLRPLTDHVSKGLLPVAGKPLVQYNIETLRDAGITDICLVVRPDQASQYAMAFGNGYSLGVDLTLRFQIRPNGIGDALFRAESWAGDSNIMVLLGDSIFGHYNFSRDIREMDLNTAEETSYGAVIYYANEKDPSWCAQLEWDYEAINLKNKIRNIHEKPKKIVSHDVVPGVYLYRNDVWDRIKKLQPSDRGEIEITDLNRSYLEDGKLKALPYVGLWMDAGTDMNAYIKAQTEPNLP